LIEYHIDSQQKNITLKFKYNLKVWNEFKKKLEYK